MASTISAPEVPSTSGQMFYCHQCSHQWRKVENTDFLCPQCRDGFIEEMNDSNNPQAERDNSDPVFSDLIFRIMSDLSPSPARAQASASRRVRSRSPRMLWIGGREANGPTAASAAYRRRATDRFFDLDDFMTSFLSTPRSQPISQRQLDEIPRETITDSLSSVQCSICFDEFKVAESDVRKLPCNHLFHENCIFPWLRINGSCPVCRARLATGEEDGAAEAATPREDNVGNDSPAPRPSGANSRNRFTDHILRFMRFRRNPHRRIREGRDLRAMVHDHAVPTSHESAVAAAGTLERRRAALAIRAGAALGRSRYSPSARSLSSSAFRAVASNNAEAGLSPLRNIAFMEGMPSRVTRSNSAAAAFSAIVDLTSSDTETSTNSQVINDNPSSSSSSSSSSNSSSSSLSSPSVMSDVIIASSPDSFHSFHSPLSSSNSSGDEE